VDEILRRRAVAESSHHRGCRRAPGSRPSRRRSLLSAPLVISALVVLLLASPAGAASSTLEAAVGVPGSAPSLTALLALQQAELTVADGSAGDFLGWSVALSGDTALVGSPGDQVGAVPWRGCAYVFVRSGSTWTLQQRLTAADAGTLDDELGWSVALSGDTALVGGPYVGADDRGAVYVFVRSAGTWSQEGPALVATDGAANDYFGCSVALSGDMALIGAHGADVGSQTNQGAAYVFVRSGSTWAFEKQLIAGDVDDAFGYSVALAGDTAVVGAPTGGADVEGAARVFVRSGSDWALQQQLTLADAAAGDYFGYSVALSGDTALVGAPHDDVGADADQGSAAVFVRSGSNWSLDGRLTAAAGDGAGGRVVGRRDGPPGRRRRRCTAAPCTSCCCLRVERRGRLGASHWPRVHRLERATATTAPRTSLATRRMLGRGWRAWEGQGRRRQGGRGGGVRRGKRGRAAVFGQGPGGCGEEG